MKHPATFKLPAAVSRYRMAEENCPHWDYDGDGCGHACCDELQAAERALQAIRREIAQSRVYAKA